MRILYNATTNYKGGSAQRASSFVVEANRDRRGHQWCMALTPSQADVAAQCSSEIEVHVFDERPSQSRQARAALLQLEQTFQPDCVYTQLGPAYVHFRSLHLLGIADAWVTHPSWRAFRTLKSPFEWLKLAAAGIYKAYWLRFAQAWVVETEYARQAYHRLHRQPLSKIAVVPNTVGRIYRETTPCTLVPQCDGSQPIRILTFAAPYPHKRLQFLPRVAQALQQLQPQFDFRFVVTLPEDCAEWRFIREDSVRRNVENRFENQGIVPIQNGPELYRKCHACFLPTILETFSVSYPEAMAMRVPMVTSDLPFARDLCGHGALFFSPDDPQAAAAQLASVLCDGATRQRVIESGWEVLNRLPTAERQYHMQVDLIESLFAGRSWA